MVRCITATRHLRCGTNTFRSAVISRTPRAYYRRLTRPLVFSREIVSLPFLFFCRRVSLNSCSSRTMVRSMSWISARSCSFRLESLTSCCSRAPETLDDTRYFPAQRRECKLGTLLPMSCRRRSVSDATLNIVYETQCRVSHSETSAVDAAERSKRNNRAATPPDR